VAAKRRAELGGGLAELLDRPLRGDRRLRRRGSTARRVRCHGRAVVATSAPSRAS
jgi:hypothetical protein